MASGALDLHKMCAVQACCSSSLDVGLHKMCAAQSENQSPKLHVLKNAPIAADSPYVDDIKFWRIPATVNHLLQPRRLVSRPFVLVGVCARGC